MSDRELKGVIWDMDGLLLDTERVSHDCWTAASQSMGQQVEESIFKGIIGMNRKSWEAKLRNDLDHQLDVDRLIELANEHYTRAIEAGVPMKVGARDCLDWLDSKQVPQALATSTSRSYTMRKLEPHGLKPYFQSMVTGDQVEHGKPHPEIFNRAAEGMDLAANDCIVFEDSRLGVLGAAASGAEVALVFDIAVHDEESLSKADHRFDTLLDALPYLQAIFG